MPGCVQAALHGQPLGSFAAACPPEHGTGPSRLPAAGFGKVEKRVRTTAGGASGSVRNLRIREDTAKYLLNLVRCLARPAPAAGLHWPTLAAGASWQCACQA